MNPGTMEGRTPIQDRPPPIEPPSGRAASNSRRRPSNRSFRAPALPPIRLSPTTAYGFGGLPDFRRLCRDPDPLAFSRPPACHARQRLSLLDCNALSYRQPSRRLRLFTTYRALSIKQSLLSSSSPQHFALARGMSPFILSLISRLTIIPVCLIQTTSGFQQSRSIYVSS